MIKATTILRTLMPLVCTTLLFSFSASAQEGPIKVDVTVRPGGTPEERVADETKTKQLRKEAEEKMAAAESAKIAANTPQSLLSKAHTVYVESGTSFFEPVQMQNALRKQEEFDRWQMALIDGWDKRCFADIIVAIDRPLFTYTFTYKITDRSTGVILATGKVTAFDGNAAAPMLAGRIIDDIKRARGEAPKKK